MEDLWRLSAADLAALIRSKKVSAKEAATSALARLDAVNPAINAVVDHRPEEVLAQAEAVDAAIARNEEPGPLAGVPVTVKVNIDQEGFATTNGLKLQRDVDRAHQQSGDRQSAQSGRRHSRAHQLPGVFLSLVHHQSDAWRHQKSARSRHHAGRLVRRRGRCGRGRHRPYRARHRYCRIDPLSRLCLRRSRPAADRRPHRGLQCVAARTHHRAADLGGIRSAGAHHRRSSGLRSRRCPAKTCAIPGGCRRRWKGRRCRSAPRCACSPTVLRRSPK